MYQQDYILRLIERVGEVLRRILGTGIPEKDIDANLQSLADEWIGLPLDLLLHAPAENLLQLFEESERLVREKCFLVAELSRAKGLTANNRADAVRYLRRAVTFLHLCGTTIDDRLQERVRSRLTELDAVI